MSIPALSFTTISSAMTKTGKRVLVASTTGITAGMKGVVGTELVHIITVVSATELEVQRAVDGTKAWPHKSGVNFYYGTADKFGPREDGSICINDGDPSFYPQYRAPLGSKARDGEGNEYLMVDFQSAVGVGSWVTLSNTFLATPIVAGARGPVGVVVQAASASDRWGWVQVFGKFSDALLVSDAASAGTSSARLAVNTSQSTPAGAARLVSDVSTEANYIFGAWPTAAVATDTTASADHTGLDIEVMLNYPYVLGYDTSWTS